MIEVEFFLFWMKSDDIGVGRMKSKMGMRRLMR